MHLFGTFFVSLFKGLYVQSIIIKKKYQSHGKSKVKTETLQKTLEPRFKSKWQDGASVKMPSALRACLSSTLFVYVYDGVSCPQSHIL